MFAMVSKLIKIGTVLLIISALCFAFYQVGQTVGEGKAKVKIVEKQVEVVRYVEKKKADIYSKPNATRSELIGLLSDGKL